MTVRNKVIEVALPIDAINEVSAREVIFVHMVGERLPDCPHLQGRESEC